MLYILVVTDTLSVEKEALEILLSEQCFVVLAKNAVHAFSLLEKQSHLMDIILLSEEFLDKNGTFISQIRTQYHQRHISFLVLAKKHGHSSEYLAIESLSRLKELLPTLAQKHIGRQAQEYQFGQLNEAHFNFQTLTQAHFLARFLSTQYPEGSNTLLGISEIFINAIEHGNLEISYDEKSALLAQGRWIEEIESRAAKEPYKNRFVSAFFKREADNIILTVRDEGHGFDWKKFQEVDPRRLIASHGRGIMMAKGLSFSELKYNDKGNVVEAVYTTEKK